MNYNSKINFGSIYKFNVTKDNLSNAMHAQEKLADIEIRDFQNYKAYTDFMPYNEMVQNGIFQRIHIAAADKYDKFIESALKRCKVDYSKQSFSDALNPQKIYNRIVLSEYASAAGKKLVSLDTAKVEKLFQEDKGFYITPNGSEGAISNRYQGVQDYIKTGRNVNASEIHLSEEYNRPKLRFIDGRHRFAVMRDMGMKKIKFAMDSDSLAVAKKYNLISE